MLSRTLLLNPFTLSLRPSFHFPLQAARRPADCRGAEPAVRGGAGGPLPSPLCR